ncbi:MAG: PEP/pyruvate-binding domain-containing protein [Ignavibacteria bacterium]
MLTETENSKKQSNFASFDRKFFDSTNDFSIIGHGSIGGKAKGLAYIKKIISENINYNEFPDFSINIPRLTVLTTGVFDDFMRSNDLFQVAYGDSDDGVIAMEFQKANIPASVVGDLRSLVNSVTSPLAIRSSSMLEDAMYHPFAGIYETKMIPNNQLDPDSRFRKLTEAIKFVFASTFFKNAKDYVKATNNKISDEKMAVIIQEVVGRRYGDRFYPNISGVGRSVNIYPIGKSKPEEGVVNLALGLGKTIVDDGISWSFSPFHPKAKPPFASINALLDETQKKFWSVNMGKPSAYDPTKETEYLLENEISSAETDGTLSYIASTFDAASEKIVPGIIRKGPRAIDFAPILDLNTVPLNKVIKTILKMCEEASGTAVEIEFAVTLDNENGLPARFGFLQVRPMVVSLKQVKITDEDLADENLLLSSAKVMGNAVLNNIDDIIFVKPGSFESKYTTLISREIEELNREMQNAGKKYLLIGFGRWGSSDPWLGIPVKWGQISNAKVIVESMLPNMNVELSQGSHFFHNITSFEVLYFSLKEDTDNNIDWNWLNEQEIVTEKNYVKHVRCKQPLLIKADGRTAKGIILKSNKNEPG